VNQPDFVLNRNIKNVLPLITLLPYYLMLGHGLKTQAVNSRWLQISGLSTSCANNFLHVQNSGIGRYWR